MKETLEDYLQRLKDRRTEDNYKYTDEDFEEYRDYIVGCWINDLSVYRCLEFFYFETLSPEEETLAKVQSVLSVGNEAQAIGLIEQYGHYKQEGLYNLEDMEAAYNAEVQGWYEFEYFIKNYKKK
jgi:hypothetical protein